MSTGSIEVEYDSLPDAVKEKADEGGYYEKMECCQCGTTMYGIPHVNEGDVFVDSSGEIRGDSAGWGGLCIEDPGALPRQLVEENGIYMCGWCLSVDTFEQQGGKIYGVDGQGNYYGAFTLGTVIDNHYLPDNSFDRSIMESAFESIARGDYQSVELSDGTQMVQVKNKVDSRYRDEVDRLINLVEDGKNPFNFSLVSAGNILYCPENELQHVEEWVKMEH